jgi:hypothetical protein
MKCEERADKMPRGGRREGAGRKPGTELDIDQYIWIGAECRQEYHALASEYREREINEHERRYDKEGAFDEIRRNQTYLRELPPERRRGPHAGREQAQDDVQMALEEMSVAAPPLQLRPFRPYRIRPEVMRRVSVRASEKYGRAITPRMVRTCWEWLVQFERSLKSGDINDSHEDDPDV